MYAALLLTLSSSLMIVYSEVARGRGWPQGNFFRSQKPMLFGWVGYFIGLYFSYLNNGFLGVGIVFIAVFPICGILLGLLRSMVQPISLIGFIISGLVCLFK